MLLTGRMPFDHTKGLKAVDDGIVLKGWRPPLPAYIPGWIQAVVRRCWHSEPSERPMFKEVIDSLHSTQEKRTVTRRFGWF